MDPVLSPSPFKSDTELPVAPANVVSTLEAIPVNSPTKVDTILAEIKALDFVNGPRVQEISGVDSKTWYELLENHAEGLSGYCYRLEYHRHPGILIVTWRGGVHSSYSALVEPLHDLARSAPDHRIHTNLDIPLPSGDLLVPDFAFMRRPPGMNRLAPLLILECGWMQSSVDLHTKALKWFTIPEVKLVMTLDLHCVPISQPPPFCLEDKALSESEFMLLVAVAKRARLDDVVVQDKIWAPKIHNIRIRLYSRKNDKLSEYNVTPNGQESIQSQDEVTKQLILHLLKFGPEIRSHLVEKGFNLPWEGFYEQLDDYLVSSAYSRYWRWTPPQPTPDLNF